jgi:hypothetical protein
MYPYGYETCSFRLRKEHTVDFSAYNVEGLGSSVGIMTGYGLDGPGIKSRWGRDFLCLSRQVLGPASCTIGSGSFSGVESGRGVTLTPYPLLVPRSKNIDLYLYSP